MWREGSVSSPSLADGVGKIAAPTGSVPARALSRGEIADLVAWLPVGGPLRLRNEAMLALMWRLGLRAGEVASLQLGDISWRAGVLLGPHWDYRDSNGGRWRVYPDGQIERKRSR